MIRTNTYIVHTRLSNQRLDPHGDPPLPRPEGGGAGRGRHFTLQGLSSQVYWHIEIRAFFKSIPEKFDGTRTCFKSNFGQKKPNGLSNLNKKVLIFLRSLDSPDSLEIPRDSLQIL